MEHPRTFGFLCAGRASWPTSFFILAALLALLAGCEGDQGPAGPAGPPGGSLELTIEFTGNVPILRADGASSLELQAKVSTLAGGNVEGITVTFKIVSGTGLISTNQANTDARGIASSTYTAGNQSGTTVVSASILQSGLTISATCDLYLDPLAVSPPLLNADANEPLMASWSHDGGLIIFQMEQYNAYGLYKVSAQGGDPIYLGNYRGGACKPNGSGHIAAFGPPAVGSYGDNQVFIIDYEGLKVTPEFQPDTFYGGMRAICWCQNGDSLLITSNTNRYFCVSPSKSVGSRRFTGPVWGNTLSSVPNSPHVVVWGSGEDYSEIYSLNLDTGDFEQLVLGGYIYSTTGPNLRGASVNSLGTTVLYSARKKTSEGYEEQNDIYSIPFTGGQSQEFLASPAEEFYPVWSPDGTKVLFCSNRSGSGYNLYVYTIP